MDVDSVSADVDVQQMAGRKLSVSSVSGDVVVTASSPGEASFENVSGDTTLRITSDKVEAAERQRRRPACRAASTAKCEMESVSGNLDLVAKALNQLRFSTVSGDALIQAGLEALGQSSTPNR